MKIFMRVAELQSFTGAAEALTLPKATVSTAVQDLEAAVGTKLLQRTTRRVSMTAEGSSFYERCKDLLADVEETESMFRSDPRALSGKIRVDMTMRMARDVVIPALPSFLEQHPLLEVEVSSTDRYVDVIREGLDCVVRSGDRVEPGVAVKRIGELQIVNCVSPSYVRRFGKPKSVEDLKSHKLIHYVQQLGGTSDGFEYHDGEKFRTLKMTGLITVNNIEAYHAACLAGLGIAQIPIGGARTALDSGALVEILPKLRSEPMAVSLVYPQRRLLAKRVRVFMDWLEPLLQQSL